MEFDLLSSVTPFSVSPVLAVFGVRQLGKASAVLVISFRAAFAKRSSSCGSTVTCTLSPSHFCLSEVVGG